MLTGTPGSHSNPEPEPLTAYADLRPDAGQTSDVDWYAAEFDRIAEQTLGGSLAV